MPNVKDGLDFMGEKVAENVDMLAEVVMGSEAKTETAKALETLHHAVMPNEKQVCESLCTCDFHNFGLIFAGQCTVCLKG